MLLVAVYHVWLGRVSGGVDVFLMISAFLLTRSAVTALEAGRPLRIGDRAARRFRTLVPPAAVVIGATVLAAGLLMPEERWVPTIRDAVASALYVENWWLVAQETDYYAAASEASLLRHFWSLSMQGQVFLLWFVLLAVAGWLCRRLAPAPWARPRRLLTLLFGAVTLGSLAWSVHITAANQTLAYFDTRARLWEFAIGSLLALVPDHLTIPRPARLALGWVGLGMVVSCGLLLDVEGSFPGYAALWPIGGAAGVMLAGRVECGYGADRLLAWRPVVWLGGVSYGLYLVHWPVLVLVLTLRERPVAGLRTGFAVILLSIALAWVLTRLVERPVRDWRAGPAASWVAAAVGVALVVAPSLGWARWLEQRDAGLQAAAAQQNPGATVLLTGASAPTGVPLLPRATSRDAQWLTYPDRCTGVVAASRNPEIAFRCRESGPAGSKTVVAVGDSHTQQLLGPLMELGRQRGWRVVTMLKGACSFGARTDQHCAAYNRDVLARVLTLHPDAVYTVATKAATNDPAHERLVDGQRPYLEQLTAAGIKVVAVRDNPRFSRSPSQCGATRSADDPTCVAPLSGVLRPQPPAGLPTDLPGVAWVDYTPLLCPSGRCPPAIGNVWTFLDGHHLTGDYSRTMTPLLARGLGAAWGRDWGSG